MKQHFIDNLQMLERHHIIRNTYKQLSNGNTIKEEFKLTIKQLTIRDISEGIIVYENIDF